MNAVGSIGFILGSQVHCKTCGKPFRAQTPRDRYCSEGCFKRAEAARAKKKRDKKLGRV